MDTNFDVNCEKAPSILSGMFQELADCLREVYAYLKEHDIAGWFCSFLLTTAKLMEASFLMAKYRAYYIDHLKCTNQLSEAMAQAHLLQLFLVDEFGEDYLDWVTDAPDALKILSELEIVKALK